MLIPSPTEYLKSHFVAFVAGAAALLAAQLYAKAVKGDFDD